MTPYANAEYLTGVLKSLFIIEAYQKIIFTSFIGLIGVKILSLFSNPSEILLNYFSLDSKTLEYVINYEEYSWIFVILIIVIYIYFSYTVIKENN